MSVVVLATILPIPEHRDEVIAAFEKVIAAVHVDDEGCELYALHEGDDSLIMIEKWASTDALQAHGKSPALGTLRNELDGKLISPLDVKVFQPHPAGTIGQGTL